jgi:predicted secreted protein
MGGGFSAIPGALGSRRSARRPQLPPPARPRRRRMAARQRASTHLRHLFAILCPQYINFTDDWRLKMRIGCAAEERVPAWRGRPRARFNNAPRRAARSAAPCQAPLRTTARLWPVLERRKWPSDAAFACLARSCHVAAPLPGLAPPLVDLLSRLPLPQSLTAARTPRSAGLRLGGPRHPRRARRPSLRGGSQGEPSLCLQVRHAARRCQAEVRAPGEVRG